MSLQATTWQTVGPYFRIGLEHLDTLRIPPPDAPGERVTIDGRVVDGNGKPVPDAVIEIWQADAKGEYSETSDFRGFGRIPTDAEGRFAFSTIKPGVVPGSGGRMQAPHLAVRLMMRGLLKDLITRMYFPNEDLDSDPVLQLVPEPRRATLIARRANGFVAAFTWEINLRGERETVFFDC
jgi:protocatechuate 3,4-dioxygenase, alpha subunit